MNFIKNFFKNDTVIGLCGIKKRKEYVFVAIPKSYQKAFIQNTENNYLLV